MRHAGRYHRRIRARRCRRAAVYFGVATALVVFLVIMTGLRRLWMDTFDAGRTIQVSQAAWSGHRLQSEERASADGADSSDGLLVLVNKSHALSSDYTVSLTTLQNQQQVADVMYDALCEMFADAEAENANLSFLVASGYRTREEQAVLLQEEIDKNLAAGMSAQEAKDDALLTVAPDGYSEHETGLAVDIVAVDNQRLDDTQSDTPENQWLQENCVDYGFILRYPEGKEDVTGFSYESWHFRYVGENAAREITQNGITLEEYLEDSGDLQSSSDSASQ